MWNLLFSHQKEYLIVGTPPHFSCTIYTKMSHIDLENDSEGGHLSAPNGSSCEVVSCRMKEANDGVELEWDEDPCNPYNWPTRYKIQQVVMMASAAFTA
jgi:hypothetical protein